MEEITSLSSELKVYESVQKIEQQKEQMQAEKKRETEREKQLQFWKQSHQHQQLQDEQDIEAEDNVRKQLIMDVINEAEENGTPFSPATLRLINHFKSKKLKFVFFFLKYS